MADSHQIISSLLGIFFLCVRIITAYIEFILTLIVKKEKKSVRGQNVLITGSGHGLGKELVKKFAGEGANVVVVDINKENADKVRDEVAETYPTIKVLSFAIDITKEDKIVELVANIKSILGTIDILVNNAGMIKKNKGHIVAISSIAGLTGTKYLADYCSSKYAVVGFMDSLEKEIHDKDANPNIHFTTICPASMSTGMFHSFTSKFPWLLPVSKPEEVAQSTLDAILLNRNLVVLPPSAMCFLKMSRLIPKRVLNLMNEFLDYGVKPHQA